MKSMFSQISKSSLFNHVMRLAIVVVCLSYSAAAAAGATSWDASWKPKADFCSGSTGYGLVYVSQSGSTPKATEWKSEAYQVSEVNQTGIGLASSASKTFYWHAKANDGYYFKGWYTDVNGNTLKSTSKAYKEVIELNTWNKSSTQTYYAKFSPLSDITITMVAPPTGSAYTVTPTGKGAYTIETQNVDFTNEGGFFTQESHLKMTFKIKNYPADQRLYAWRITENGKTTDHRVAYDITKTDAQNIAATSFAYTFTNNATVEPIFVHNRHATYVVGNDAADFLNESNYYVDLQEALNAAVSHSSHRVTVMATGELDTSEQQEYTIPEGVTLVVPGEEDFRYNIGGLRTEDIIQNASGYKEFVKFSLPHNATLNVEGGLSVYAKLTSGGTVAATSYGQIHLEDNSDTGGSEGAKINIKSGGIVNVYGYITGKPDYTKVNVETGGNIYELLQVRDWRGGTATVATAITNKGKSVFPMNQYYVHNVETMLELHRGATEYVSFGVLMSDDIVTTDAVFLTTRDGTDEQVGLFLLSEKSIIQKYLDKKTDRLIVKIKSDDDADITNAADKSIMSNVALTVASYNINSADYVLPMPCNYDIYITENTYMEIKNRVAFLAGSTLHVDATSKLVALSDVFVYDNEQHVVELTKNLNGVNSGWHNYFGVSNSALSRNTSQPKIEYNRDIDLMSYGETGKKIMKSDAQLIIDGTLEGKIYTTASGATITSNGGGRIKLTELNANLTTTNQVIQYTSSGLVSTPAVEPVTIPLSSKTQLRNEDGYAIPYVSAESNTTYVYYKPDSETKGYWKTPEIEVVDIKGDGDEDDFIVYTPEVTSHNVTCKIITDIEGFSDFTFTVSKGETSRFADGIIPNFDPSTSILTIPLTYSPSDTHDEEYREEITLTIEYTDPDGNRKEGTHTIALIVKQDYKPQFKLQIGEYTYSEDGDYLFQNVIVGEQSTSAFSILPAENNIAATNFVTWVKTVETPFSVDEANNQLVFAPESAGKFEKTLQVCASYNNGTPDDASDDIKTCISINLTADGILQENNLTLKNEKIAVIKDNTLLLNFEDLFDATTGNGNSVSFSPVDNAATYATISIVDGKYQIKGIEVNEEVEFTYTQGQTNTMKEATGILKVEVKPEVKFNWKYLYYGNTFTDPIDTENTGWTLAVKDPTSDCGKQINLVNSNGEWFATVETPADPTQECEVSFVYKQGVNTIEFGPIPVFSDPKILPLCVEDGLSAERTYEAMTIKEQTKNVKFITQSGDNDDYVEFDYTAQGDNERPTWTFEFIGVADQMTFELAQGGTTGEWLIEDVSLAIPMTLFSGTLKSGTNTIDMDYNTQKVRITYDGMSENVEKVRLKNICISKLNISADMDKMYLPVEILDDNTLNPSSRTVQITYAQDAEGQSIRVVDNNQNVITAITPNINTLPDIGDKRVATQEIVITNNSCITEGDYTLLIGNDFALPIRTYFYPQLLPIISNDWTGQKAEYFYYYLADNPRYVTWDDAKHAMLLQVPLDGGSRDAIFTYKGGPATMSFDVTANITLNRWQQYWVVEESADGSDWDPVTTEEVKPTITVNGNTSTIEMPTLRYTSKYIRIINTEASEMYVSNLKIEGVPAVDVVVPHEGHYVEPGVVDVEGKLNFSSGDPSVLNVMAINLTKLKVKLNKPELFDVQLEGNTINTVGVVLDNSHMSIGTHRVGELSMNVTWKQVTNIDQAELTFYNVVKDANGNEQEILMATVKLLGAKDYITISNAKETGVFTGINEELYPDHPFKDEDNDKYKYAYREVDLTNTFDKDGIALFDYLVVYTETTADGTKITPPTKTAGSNAETPYFIYRKAQNPETLEYDRYQFVCDVENANSGEKGKLHTKLDDQGNPLVPHAKLGTIEVLDQGMQYIDIAENEHLSVYMTGFCPYASTGYTKDDEGVWIFRGKSTSQLDVYLEDCHIYSRDKTLDGHSYTGKEDPGANIFQEDFARGSGGVLVFECNTEPVDGATPSAFKVNIHTRGTNLLKSNYGCFYQIFGMRAYQVSSPVQIRLTSNVKYVDFSETHLTFDDLWPTELTTKTINGVEVTSYDSIRTNGFISLQKQANNAPSIDMGNGNTVVNFRGGQVELQNAQNVSDKYKTTLAISYRSGIMAAGGLNVQMARGIGTDDAKGGIVNFYDGTITVIPMKVASTDRKYYLMDVLPDGSESDMTSCLRCPQNTYVYGGSICMLRACMDPTSKGGAPTDGHSGKYLGRFVYTSEHGYDYNTADKLKPANKDNLEQWLVKPQKFPTDITLFEGLSAYYTANGYTYGIESVTPNEKEELILWIPDGYGGVKAEEDKQLIHWEACMTEIQAVLGSAGVLEIGGTVGGNVSIEPIEEVANLLYCDLDENIYEVISANNGDDENPIYTYEAPIKVPEGFQMDGIPVDLGAYIYKAPKSVGNRVYEVTNDADYEINNKIYYITSVSSDVWMTFTAPFDVQNIWVVETYDETQLQKRQPTPESKKSQRSIVLAEQAKNNADFAAFFGAAMALGSQQSFEEIFEDYIEWAKIQDKEDGLYDGTSPYSLRGMYPLTPYDGTNWATANFYLNRNDGTWALKEKVNPEDEDEFVVEWIVPALNEYGNSIMLKKGETYSMLFPYCTGCWKDEWDEGEYPRDNWDYWSGKFLIFESTAATEEKPHVLRGKNFLQAAKPATGEWIFEGAEALNVNQALLTGNSTFGFLPAEIREGIYMYDDYASDEKFLPYIPDDDSSTPDVMINPSNSFLITKVANPQGMPAVRITRDGKITYGGGANPDDNPDDGTLTGGHMPTIGAGNALFITSVSGGINISVAQPQYVRVISTTGSTIFNGYITTSTNVQLPMDGVYVIAGETEVHKIFY